MYTRYIANILYGLNSEKRLDIFRLLLCTGGADDLAVGETDAFLAGLEQEMLATRQLYLDGVISKEVYVSETRALYSKAQSRMT